MAPRKTAWCHQDHCWSQRVCMLMSFHFLYCWLPPPPSLQALQLQWTLSTLPTTPMPSSVGLVRFQTQSEPKLDQPEHQNWVQVQCLPQTRPLVPFTVWQIPEPCECVLTGFKPEPESFCKCRYQLWNDEIYCTFWNVVWAQKSAQAHKSFTACEFVWHVACL